VCVCACVCVCVRACVHVFVCINLHMCILYVYIIVYICKIHTENICRPLDLLCVVGNSATVCDSGSRTTTYTSLFHNKNKCYFL